MMFSLVYLIWIIWKNGILDFEHKKKIILQLLFNEL